MTNQKTRQNQSPPLTSEQIAKNIALASGNNLHCEVANYFRANDWSVSLSPYYVDPADSKSKEADLIVEKDFLSNKSNHSARFAVAIRLHIECKYVSDHAVFWFDAINSEQATKLAKGQGAFSAGNTSISQHHYLRNRPTVAKLYASQNDANRNEDKDPIYRALTQSLRGYINNRRVRESTLKRESWQTVHTFEYPVIVFSNFEKFFQTSIVNPGPPVPITDNFCFELDYAYRTSVIMNSIEYLLVDFVDFKRIQLFLDSMDLHIAAAHHMIQPS